LQATIELLGDRAEAKQAWRVGDDASSSRIEPYRGTVKPLERA
jgi:hypothetical protein